MGSQWSPRTLVYIPSHSHYRTNIQSQLTVFLERDSEWPTSASIDSTHTTLPMTDTNISRNPQCHDAGCVHTWSMPKPMGSGEVPVGSAHPKLVQLAGSNSTGPLILTDGKPGLFMCRGGQAVGRAQNWEMISSNLAAAHNNTLGEG